jgi:hypothetical protein
MTGEYQLRGIAPRMPLWHGINERLKVKRHQGGRCCSSQAEEVQLALRRACGPAQKRATAEETVSPS